MLSIILLIPKVGEYKRYCAKENIKNLVIDNLEFLNESIENENYNNLLELEEVKDKQFWKNNSDGIIVEYFAKDMVLYLLFMICIKIGYFLFLTLAVDLIIKENIFWVMFLSIFIV